MSKILEHLAPPDNRRGRRHWKQQQKAVHIAIQESFSKQDKWDAYENAETEEDRKTILSEILNS